jgi:1-deoxy-D-xylulose-5-phosphate reductoisomerase
MPRLALFGSTGSIGTQTLEVVRGLPEYSVSALAARSSWRPLLEQVRAFRPRWVALEDPTAAAELARHLDPAVELFSGAGAAAELARAAEYDVCVQGLVGAAGLEPSLEVLRRGRRLALANKETLVVAGELVMRAAREHGGEVVPIDSEHSAIHQCLRGEDPRSVRAVYLTASGGALRDLPLEQLAAVTPDEALRHPNWSMGPRITVDSATLVNKALEIVEAHHLFGLAPEQIRVLLHRQSVVHSMVEFVDGSLLAQLGPPDMRGPIHYALHQPLRVPTGLSGYAPELFRRLTFEEVDPARYPALELGYECVRAGGDAACALNAADEVAVEAFLDGRLAFPAVVEVLRECVARRPRLHGDLPRLLESDRRARQLARELVSARPSPPVAGSRR